MRRPELALALLLVGCDGGATPTPATPSPAPGLDPAGPQRSDGPSPSAGSPGSAATPPPGGTTLQITGGDAVPIQLRFTRISGLHRGYFGQEALVAALGKALGRCTDHTVEVHVSWSQEALTGRIQAILPPGTTACGPTAVPGGFDLRPLVPITQALARYRDAVAGTSDFRISSFQVGVDLVGARTVCRLRIAGQHPPDGTRFHPCVRVGGDQICGAGDPDEGVVRLQLDDPASRKALATCLTPG